MVFGFFNLSLIVLIYIGKDLLIILCALGVIFIFGLVAFIIIKLKKLDIYKKFIKK